MQHKGEIVKNAIQNSGHSITKLSSKLGKSRRWMYHVFENSNVPLDVILEIGEIIHYDFTNEIKELKKYRQSQINLASLKSQESTYHPNLNVDYWKDKYLNLLEKYNALLLKSSAKQKKVTVREK